MNSADHSVDHLLKVNSPLAIALRVYAEDAGWAIQQATDREFVAVSRCGATIAVTTELDPTGHERVLTATGQWPDERPQTLAYRFEFTDDPRAEAREFVGIYSNW